MEYLTDRVQRLLEASSWRSPEPPRILEIGAGFAWMCRAAKTLFQPSVTVAQDITDEVSAECPWADRYHVCDADDPALTQYGSYHVASMTHVIEHLVDPLAMLIRIRQMIEVGGLLFVTGPHRPKGWVQGGPLEAWAGWSYNHTPAHTQYFDRGSMELLAGRARFKLTHWDATGEDGQVFEAWLTPRSAACQR